jgi:hypothetical protein
MAAFVDVKHGVQFCSSRSNPYPIGGFGVKRAILKRYGQKANSKKEITIYQTANEPT